MIQSSVKLSALRANSSFLGALPSVPRQFNSSPLNATGRPMPRVSVSPEFPRPLPTNTANASFCCFIKFARLSGCILCISPKRCCSAFIVTAMARNFLKVWMHSAPLPCKCACELVFLSQTFTRVRNEVLLSRLPAILSIVPFRFSQLFARHCHGDGALPYMANASS